MYNPTNPPEEWVQWTIAPALAYGFPSRWLGGEGFFQPSGSADMPGTQARPPVTRGPFCFSQLYSFHAVPSSNATSTTHGAIFVTPLAQ